MKPEKGKPETAPGASVAFQLQKQPDDAEQDKNDGSERHAAAGSGGGRRHAGAVSRRGRFAGAVPAVSLPADDAVFREIAEKGIFAPSEIIRRHRVSSFLSASA